MTLAIVLEPTPIKTDSYGVVRVAKTHVTLDTVVIAFLEGCTPEVCHPAWSRAKIICLLSPTSKC